MASLRKCDLFINGKVVKPSGRKYFTRENPATEAPFAQIAESSSRDVDRAVKAARKSFTSWSKVPPQERSKVILNIAEILNKTESAIKMKIKRAKHKSQLVYKQFYKD